MDFLFSEPNPLYEALNGSVYVEIATALGVPDDAIVLYVDLNSATFTLRSPSVVLIPEEIVPTPITTVASSWPIDVLDNVLMSNWLPQYRRSIESFKLQRESMEK